MARQTVEKMPLSASIDGKRVLVVATATAGTLIHTATAGALQIDWIHLNAQNSHTADVLLTIEWGGTTSPNDVVQQTITLKSGLSPVIVGDPLRNTLLVRAFASVASVVTIGGFVERSTLEG